MRMILLGTGPFAVPTCQQLLEDGHDIALVVTRPLANPHAKKPPARPVHEWASQAGLEIYDPASINAPEAVERLTELQADLMFVCDYGQILSQACLRTTRLGGINLHGSLLPRHRGAAPVQWTLLSGDDQAGVTLIHMTPGLDAGPALASAQTQVGQDETAEQLEPRLAQLGVAATQRAVGLLTEWDGQSPIGTAQDTGLVTKAPRFAKSDGQLDFHRTAEQLARQIRACQPWPSTFAELVWPEGKRVRLLVKAARAIPNRLTVLKSAAVGTVAVLDTTLGDTTKLDLTSQSEPGEREVWQPLVSATSAIEGSPLSRYSDWSAPWQRVLAVATAEGTLLIARVGPAGKREMSVDEFLRGHAIRESAHFESA